MSTEVLDDLVSSGVLEGGAAIAKLTTYKLGGPARYFGAVESPAALISVVDAWRGSGVELLLIGRGSNLVVADAGFDGLVLQLGGTFSHVEIGKGEISAGAAVSLPQLARRAVKAGWGGLEWCVGVPGTVGGAVTMNAGCFGSETADVLVGATVLDAESGRVSTETPDSLKMAYRSTNLAARHVVIDALFSVHAVDPEVGEREMRDITRWRRDHQPGGTYNAGSVFKNPEGDPAGRLIDAAGLKGLRRGDVAVSERHANFFVAGPNAVAQDVYDLVDVVADKVAEATGITLEPELRFAGRFEPRG